MANREIEAKLLLTAADRTGRAFTSLSGKLKGVHRQAEAYNRQSNRNMKTAVAVARTSAMAATAVAAVGAAAYKNFAGDERTLTRIGITAEATREQMEAIRDELFSIANSTGMQFEDSILGLDALTASGRTLHEAMALLPSVMATAQASGAEVVDIATSADALFVSLGISAKDMQGAFDILVAGGKAGKFELKDMAQFLPSLAPAFKALGYEGEAGLQKLIAALQTVRTQTGTSSEAATAFTDVLTKMESQTVTNNFKRFGVDLRGNLEKARKEGRDVLETFVALSKQAVKGDLSKLPQLFTDKQMLIGMRSLITGADAFDRFLAALQDVDGSTMKDLNTVLADQQAEIDKLANSWDRLMSNLGSSVAGPVGDVLGSTNDRIEFGQALAKGLEDEDLGLFEKWLYRAYPDRKDPWIIEQAKQGGYKFPTFEGGSRETVDPETMQIPVPSRAGIGRSRGARAMEGAIGIPVARKDYVAPIHAEQLYDAPIGPPAAPRNRIQVGVAGAGIRAAVERERAMEATAKLDLDSGEAEADLEQFSQKAAQPMRSQLDLDTSAAEAKLDRLHNKARQIGAAVSAGTRNLGRSMPGAGQ